MERVCWVREEVEGRAGGYNKRQRDKRGVRVCGDSLVLWCDGVTGGAEPGGKMS